MKKSEQVQIAQTRMSDLVQYADAAKDILRELLNGLAKADMIKQIQELGLSDRGLNFLCEGIALETEDYEICAAVQEIKRQRGLN